jgi:hypothetical protein
LVLDTLPRVIAYDDFECNMKRFRIARSRIPSVMLS